MNPTQYERSAEPGARRFRDADRIGRLRGCIGYTTAVKPLFITVRDTAMFAALRDPRFHEVSVEELPRLKYEISVLSPLRRAVDVEQIHVGEHGLLMKNGDKEGRCFPGAVEQVGTG